MKLNEIKQAVLEGKKVHWANTAYRVKEFDGVFYIEHSGSGSSIGLTWRDGITLNGKESEFFVA